ncbi:DUF262 domain-containing protein [Enterovibrio norvegicus]|uniref:DUF262 domain-containing protein n=1 Tax=Enterovibrio norvegicus TaxID=188144 RepID=UPI000C839B2D|nr:DUF262 domain-containing protein [Enterovibrio norvegicus]PMN65402.1 hypothetical protein BCT27_08250 [Enterovibrio norvegicus]
MIRYQVRSKELIDLVNEIKSRRLILSPYFQRNLVWRDVHKIDFIKTILMGLPFPQIFIAKGSIDLESMTTTSCIVDGQQRMSAIVEFTSNKLKVDSKLFKDFTPEIREKVLKYQIPIIDLDLQNDAPEVKEIFQRLNRTFYSLNAIEKLSSEYAASEFMLIAKHFTGEIVFKEESDEDSLLLIDPTIPESFIEWANSHEVNHFKKLIVEGNVFTPYEISRQIHLMFTLNLLATFKGGLYTRNELATRYLDELKEGFEEKDQVLDRLESTSEFILKLDLSNKSYWFNKANMFSLFSHLMKTDNLTLLGEIDEVKEKLNSFEQNIPADYQIAAKEGVNNRKERLIRAQHLKDLLG